MKKSISISLIILISIGMLHLSLANHYCGGKIAASKVSFSGHLANCGMEVTETQEPHCGINFNKRCCDDVVISYLIEGYYLSSSSSVPEFFQYKFQILDIPVFTSFYPVTILKSPDTNVNPPGVFMSTHVDLSAICIYRI